LLDLLLADRSDPADNVRRVAAAGLRGLVISVVADPNQVMAAYAAGAAGYLTKDRDLHEVARDRPGGIASGRDPCPPELAFAMAHDRRPRRPRLSTRELQLPLAYAAGMTLDAAARRVGIRPATAKHHLERIKQKYRSAGRPTYTKLDLATRVREDGLLRPAAATPKGPRQRQPRRRGDELVSTDVPASQFPPRPGRRRGCPRGVPHGRCGSRPDGRSRPVGQQRPEPRQRVSAR